MSGHQQWGGAPASSGGGGKALPIAIGAGLAVGVFLGLILIRGTGGESEAEAKTGDDDGSEVAKVEIDAGPAVAIDAAVVAAKTPDAAPAKPTVTKVNLTLAVTPTDAEDLEITIDGEPLTGTTFTHERPPEAKPTKVSVRIKAKGHRSYHKKIVLDGDKTVEVALRPRRKSGGGKTGGGKTGGGKTGPGGLIDL